LPDIHRRMAWREWAALQDAFLRVCPQRQQAKDRGYEVAEHVQQPVTLVMRPLMMVSAHEPAVFVPV